MLRRNRSRGSAVRRSNNNNGGRPTSDRGVYERPESRPRYGVASQNYERYLNQAKEALSSGDRVQAEYYYQHADHFLRILNEYREQREAQQPTVQPVIQDHPQPEAVNELTLVTPAESSPQSEAAIASPSVNSEPQAEAPKAEPRRPARRQRPKVQEAAAPEVTTAE
ncbi:DUF4167 domain-containing protein [Candidatus Odyssella thessalonicensis]|uniref:DUF4167 domain-containing protein n=1 Tax=Candidatus Odyssella thessalonicensis TaxID=84647 RepID=UPI000225B718|nr:DUF4167 domain-containing protein [Candidatus Odyssella thessalonicensis]